MLLIWEKRPSEMSNAFCGHRVLSSQSCLSLSYFHIRIFTSLLSSIWAADASCLKHVAKQLSNWRSASRLWLCPLIFCHTLVWCNKQKLQLSPTDPLVSVGIGVTGSSAVDVFTCIYWVKSSQQENWIWCKLLIVYWNVTLVYGFI